MAEITDLITEQPRIKPGKDRKGRFIESNPFGGSRPNAGRKPMPEARKHALESFHQGLPEAVDYLITCLRSNNPDDRKWACDLMIKKGIPSVEALLIRGEVTTQNLLKMPEMPPEVEAQFRVLADSLAIIPGNT